MPSIYDFVGPCGAPPYAVVLACEAVGIERPADVPWRRGDGACCSGVYFATYDFQFRDGAVVRLAVGQCRRCKTVWWLG